MKRPYLKAKYKPKRKVGNVNFGKVVLTLMLVSIMVLGSYEPVKASEEQLYYYERYYVKKLYDTDSSKPYKYAVELWDYSTERITDAGSMGASAGLYYNCEPEVEEYTATDGSIFKSYTGKLKFTDYIHYRNALGKYAYYKDSDTKYYYGYVEKVDKEQFWLNVARAGEITQKRTGKFIYGRDYKDKYKDTITGKYTEYPSNGVHNDGYWYVRKGLVNNNPTLTLLIPIENDYFGKEKAINVSGSVKDVDNGDNLAVKYTLNGISTHTNKTIYTTTANGSNQNFSHNIIVDGTIPEGVYQLNIWAEDNKGGKSSIVSRTIKIDKTAPSSPTITLSNNNWTKENVTVTITNGSESSNSYQSGVQKSQYKIGNGSWTDYNSLFAIKDEGIIKIYIRTIDKVGNISNEVSRTIKIDKTKPTKPSISISPETPTNKDVTITIISGTDNGSGVNRTEYRIDKGNWTTYTAPFKMSSNGNVEARTIDKVGNISDVGSITISNINKTLPVITIEPYNTEWTNKDIIVKAKTDKGTLNQESYTFTENGDFTFIAVDEYGNTAKKTITITNIDKVKPKIKITIGN